MAFTNLPTLTVHKLPLLLHVIIETAAAFTFIFKPSRQLPPALVSENSDYILPTHSETSYLSSSYPRPKTQPLGDNSHLSRRIISSSPSPPPSDGISTPTAEEDAHDGKTTQTSFDEASTATKELNLILLNYGGLLLTTNFTCLVFLVRPVFDDLAGAVSLCMASYHVWPVWRALSRMRIYKDTTAGGRGTRETRNQKFLGGPAFHLVLHLSLLGGLVWAGLSV